MTGTRVWDGTGNDPNPSGGTGVGVPSLVWGRVWSRINSENSPLPTYWWYLTQGRRRGSDGEGSYNLRLLRTTRRAGWGTPSTDSVQYSVAVFPRPWVPKDPTTTHRKVLHHCKPLHRHVKRALLTVTDLGPVSREMSLHYDLLVSSHRPDPLRRGTPGKGT